MACIYIISSILIPSNKGEVRWRCGLLTCDVVQAQHISNISFLLEKYMRNCPHLTWVKLVVLKHSVVLNRQMESAVGIFFIQEQMRR